jgi:hypothetical protein
MFTSVLRRTAALFGLVILSATLAGSPVLAASPADILQEQIDALETRIEALEADTGPVGQPTSYLMAILPVTNGVIDDSEWDLCTSSHGGRPANTKDVLTLPWDPTTGPAEAWVRPYIVASEGINGLVDITGVTGGLHEIACGDVVDDMPWASPASLETGMVAMKGASAIRQCHLEFKILCVIPEPSSAP